MRRVFVLEQTRVDISNARRFGKIVEVFSDSVERPSIFDIVGINDALEDRLHQLQYDPKEDSILIAGNTITLCTAAAFLGSRFGEFDALVFDSRKREYERVTFGGKSDVE